MINSIKSLLKRTEEIESTLQNIEQSSLKKFNGVFSLKNNFANLAIISNQKIFLSKIDVFKNNNVTFQYSLAINISSKQSITFKLKLDDTTLSKSIKEYSIGNHNITFYESYTPLIDKTVNLYLEILLNDDKLIYLQESSLLVWGVKQTERLIHGYQTTKTNDKLLLSYINNNTLYYKFTDLTPASYEKNDFNFHSNSLSYAFVYTNQTNKVLLFRIDTNKNLLFSEFLNSNEKIIASNVNYVSAISSNDTILVSYIKNNDCYLFKINNGIFSTHVKFSKLKRAISKCHVFFNNFSDTFYLILTDINKSNYLIESIDSHSDYAESLSASYNLEIKTYGVSNEL